MNESQKMKIARLMTACNLVLKAPSFIIFTKASMRNGMA